MNRENQNIKFSILIPARNEEKYIGQCLDSVRDASKFYPDQVETIVCLNRCTDKTEDIARSYNAIIITEDSRNMAKIRNTAASIARGEIIVTIDADSRMSKNMLAEIDRLLGKGNCIGGGVRVQPDRWSPGILCSCLVLLPVMFYHRVSGGLFWCYRKDFESIGGFNESKVCVEDLDFAKRLKAYGKIKKKKFVTLLKAHIITSTRKFDQFGDWHMIRNLPMVIKVFQGNDQKIADEYYYDFPR